MPVIQITLVAGRSMEQKKKLYREVTDAVHRTLGTPPEGIRIILNEVPPAHFAVAGEPKTGPSGHASGSGSGSG